MTSNSPCPLIRPAASADAATIRRVHLAAFPTAVEADLVERLDQDAGPCLMALALSGAPLPAQGRADYASAFAELEQHE